LRHPGGPGEPVGAVKGWDRVKSGLGRHVDRRLEKSIISDQRYMKMQGKIEDNAKAFESEDLVTHHFLVDLICGNSH